MKISYNKLICDRIPEIIKASGKTCVTEVLSDEEYLNMIDAKLDEELAEYHKDENLDGGAGRFAGSNLCSCNSSRIYSERIGKSTS